MSIHKVLCIVVTFRQAVKLKNQPAQVQVARVLGLRRREDRDPGYGRPENLEKAR